MNAEQLNLIHRPQEEPDKRSCGKLDHYLREFNSRKAVCRQAVPRLPLLGGDGLNQTRIVVLGRVDTRAHRPRDQ